MNHKRFIYRNGELIPKKIEKSVPNINIFKDKDHNDNINNKSRNTNLNYHDNNYSSKSQFEEKILYHKNNINEDINNNKSFKKTNALTEANYFTSKINKKNKKQLKNLNLYSQIEHICNHIYLSPNNKHKKNIFIEMYEKENDYVKKLNENYLIRDALIKKKYYSRNFPRLIKYSSSVKAQSFNKNIIRYKANDKTNKTNKDEIIKKENNEDKNETLYNKHKSNNIEEIIPYKYKHPQIYKLKNENKIKLPKIKKEQNKNIDFENLIPVKKGIKKDEKVNEYMFFKVMKQNRLKKFHI